MLAGIPGPALALARRVAPSLVLLSPLAAQLPSSAEVVRVSSMAALGSSDPAGLTVLPNGHLLLVDSEVEETPFFAGFNVLELARGGTLVRRLSTTAFSNEPTDVAYHPLRGTLFFTDDDLWRIFECTLDDDGLHVVASFATGSVQLADPEGICVDPTTGDLWVADGVSRHVVRLSPDGALLASFVGPFGMNDPESIEFDPRTGNLLVVSGFDKKIFELTTAGALVSTMDLYPIRKKYGINLMKGVALAPASSQPSGAAMRSLYLADYGWDEVLDGRLFEVALDAPTVETCDLTPLGQHDLSSLGSSDPSGVTLLPSGNLLFVDSEIDETPWFTGVNVFEVARDGQLVRTATTTAFSVEPTGVAWNPVTSTLFLTDDDQRTMFQCALDDTGLTLVDAFSLTPFGQWDPEGVAVDPTTGHLWVAGGSMRLVQELTPDGTLVSTFTVPTAVPDPKDVAWDPVRGDLLLVSGPKKVLHRFSTAGQLLGETSLKPLRQEYGINLLNGVVVAPATSGGGDLSLWFADYGWDEQLDGRFFEASLDDSPVVLPLEDRAVAVGDTLVVPVTAVDPDGDVPLFTEESLPWFATLVDAGDGTASIVLQPGPGDVGTWTVAVRANSPGCALAGVGAFQLTVLE